MDDLGEKTRSVARLLRKSQRTVALTGAGISVDSGIPDFRSPGGLWSRFDPLEYAHIDAFVRNPEKVWRMLEELASIVGDARPNPGHVGLADLESLGCLHSVITQNVDSLHQEAGSSHVIEFHGNGRRLACLECGQRVGREEIDRNEHPPRCSCGTILKPDVVFFGEVIPREASLEAQAEVSRSEAMLVVGTSAEVAPANQLPGVAKRAGASIIEINLERTSLSDTVTDYLLLGRASQIIPQIVEAVRSIDKG